MYVCLACAAHAGERRSFKSQSLLSVNAQCERLGIKLPCSSIALLLIPNIIKTNSYKLFFEKDAKEKNCFYDTRWNKTKSCCRFTRRHFYMLQETLPRRTETINPGINVGTSYLLFCSTHVSKKVQQSCHTRIIQLQMPHNI